MTVYIFPSRRFPARFLNHRSQELSWQQPMLITLLSIAEAKATESHSCHSASVCCWCSEHFRFPFFFLRVLYDLILNWVLSSYDFNSRATVLALVLLAMHGIAIYSTLRLSDSDYSYYSSNQHLLHWSFSNSEVGMSEIMVPLNPLVNHHFPIFSKMAI